PSSEPPGQSVDQSLDGVRLRLDDVAQPELARGFRGDGADRGGDESPARRGRGSHQVDEGSNRGRRRERDRVDAAAPDLRRKRAEITPDRHGPIHRNRFDLGTVLSKRRAKYFSPIL